MQGVRKDSEGSEGAAGSQTNASVLVFDPIKHTYTLDGKLIPSVTTVLKRATIIDTTWYREPCTKRGTDIHNAIECIESVEHGLPRIMAYIHFRMAEGYFPVDVGMSVYSERHMYGGTIDTAGMLYGEYSVIDFKSGRAPEWVRLQLAAYCHCLVEMGKCAKMPRGYSLELRKNGTYDLKQHDMKSGLEEFLEARKRIDEPPIF